MNRSQRRKALKQVNTPKKFEEAMSYGLEIQRKDFEEQKKMFTDVLLTMVAYTIQYKLGLGKKRLPQIMDDILFNIDAFNTGHLSHEDFYTIKEDLKKYGIEI